VANDAETQAFIDTLDERAQKEYKAGLDLAENLEKMKAAGYTDSTTYYSAYRQNMLNIAKEYDDKEFKTAKDNADRIAKIQLDTRFDLANAITKINSDFAKEDIKNVEAQLSSTLKATRGNYQAQKDAIQLAINKLIEYRDASKEAGYGTKEFDDAIKNLGFSLEGLVDPIENFNTQLTNIIKLRGAGMEDASL
jgi:methylphosphotriester-DNA--protein-cysteine methyltransferase